MRTRASRPAAVPCRRSATPAVWQMSRFPSVGPETDCRVALHLLDQGHFPGEVVARVFLVIGSVVVRLVPDIVARGGRTLHAAFRRPAGGEPSRVSALKHAHPGLWPQRRGFGWGEVRNLDVF